MLSQSLPLKARRQAFTLVDEVEDVGIGCWQGNKMSSFSMFKMSGRLGHLKELLSLILSMKLRMT